MEWIINNPLFYGFFATLAFGGCGGHVTRVTSQMSASHECTEASKKHRNSLKSPIIQILSDMLYLVALHSQN